jgi:hypothetical protein
MARIETSFERRIDRRTFLLGSFAVSTGVAAETPRLETFTQWLKASRKTRELALQPCVERIRAMDLSIQAWVQVLPQKPTGEGKLSGIPFGVKDIIETLRFIHQTRKYRRHACQALRCAKGCYVL